MCWARRVRRARRACKERPQHWHSAKNSPSTGPSRAQPRKTSPGVTPPAVFSRKNSPSTPQTDVFGPFFVRWANFFALTPTIRPSRANFFARRTQPRGNCETAITNATADAGQRETTITSATEKRIKNAHFSPTKAMTVSTPHAHERAKAMSVSSEARPAPAKATPVSRKRFTMPAGYGGARLRRPWAVAGPGRASRRRAEPLGSQRGRRAGGPPPTGTPSSPAQRVRPDGAQNTSGATSNKLNREFRLRQPWAAAGPGRHHTAPKASPVWRAPEGPENPAAAAVGGGGAWPGFETTRRAKLAARTASGRATAHGRTKQPGQRDSTCSARNTSGPTATPAARQTALTLRRRRARGVPCS